MYQIPMRQAKPENDQSSFSLLIVDDSEDFRTLLKAYLRDFPFRIDEAVDGEDAVELFERNAYDLVIMDIIMPLMDGVDAIAAIRNMEARRVAGHAWIIALTAEDSVETGVDCLEAGADRILMKPVSRMGLTEAVCGLLRIEPLRN